MKWFSLISKKLKYFQFWYEFKSYVQVRRFFCREFNVHARDGPQNNAIKRIVKHFEDKSTIRKSYKRNRERPATIIRTRQTSTRYAISPSTRYAISPSTRYAISPRSPLFVAFNARHGLLGITGLKKAIKRSLSMLHVIVTSSKCSMMIYRKRYLRANSEWAGSCKMGPHLIQHVKLLLI